MGQAERDGTARVAIVGGGPRGLAAVEALRRHSDRRAVRATMFEPHHAPGAGPNYDPSQTPLNLLNIPLRSIDLPDAATGESFDEWAVREAPGFGEDDYIPRALMGRYFADRLRLTTDAVSERFGVEVEAERIAAARRGKGGWMLRSDRGATFGPFDEVVLCAGHQLIEDAQIERWKTHAAKSGAVFGGAYPSAELIAATQWRGRDVGIRGFGLAMIDVARVLTEGLGGRFERGADGTLAYRASGNEPARLAPFSRDGMAPAPKPATGEADAAYVVGEEERSALREAVGRVIDEDDDGLGPVFRVLAAATGRVLGGDETRVLQWLEDGAGDDPGVPDEERPAVAMAHYLAMAQARRKPSVGYAAGQLWRHFQNDLRIAFNPREKSACVARALVGFDGEMKRFSYGPPAEATGRLLALNAAGILTLRRVDDPDIECVAGGWRITGEGDAIVASAMIDSVLAGPVLEKVGSPLVASLMREGLLCAFDGKLGARLRPDGQVVDAGGSPVEGLSMLGRLGNGSVIAADSLHDCFGAAVGRWASRVLVPTG